MRPAYIATFFSTQTGVGWVQASFVNGDSDEQKTRVLRKNRRMWWSIRGDVREWTLENWERWEEEQPEWFNDNFRASIDDDMIPPASLRKLKGQDVERRRSSFGEQLGLGSGRHSARVGAEPEEN
jgi:hypothetical protein